MKCVKFESQYVNALKKLLTKGVESGDRTGTGTYRMKGGYNFKVNLQKEFPAIQGKKVIPQNALTELIWMLQGKTDIQWLKDRGVNYWDKWTNDKGELGPVYGKQIRDFNGIDQLDKVLETLRVNPDSRRMIISLWNVSELNQMSLEPCFVDFQFVQINGELDLHVNQRSSDSFIGLPYDIMLFSFFLHLVAFYSGFIASHIHLHIVDFHLYKNHVEQVKQYIDNFDKDSLGLIANKNIMIKNEIGYMFDSFDEIIDQLGTEAQFINDCDGTFGITGYESYEFIKAPVAK